MVVAQAALRLARRTESHPDLGNIGKDTHTRAKVPTATGTGDIARSCIVKLQFIYNLFIKDIILSYIREPKRVELDNKLGEPSRGTLVIPLGQGSLVAFLHLHPHKLLHGFRFSLGEHAEPLMMIAVLV